MFSIRKIFSQKKYVAFLVAVPLLLTTGLIQVECPVCEGDGTVSSSHGMENVRLERVDTEEKGILREACTMALVYKYVITLTLTNDSEEKATGWVELILVDFTEGKQLSSTYIVVSVEGKTTTTLSYDTFFRTGLDEPLKTEAYAKLLVGDVADKSCNGKGKVPLNNGVLLYFAKDRMREVQRVEEPWAPPQALPYDEESPWDFE